MPQLASVSRGRARAPFALAVDVGTSSTRAAVFDASLRPVSGTASRVAHEPSSDAAGAATLDPDAVLRAVTTCIDAALENLGRRAADIAVVGTSAFWHGLLGIDARGRATTPLFTWMDVRARDAARALSATLDQQAFHARTGCYLHSSYPVVKLRWLRDSQPRAFRRIARWVSFAEYLSLRLSGVARASHSIASATGLYDHDTRRWDWEILDAIDVAPEALSPISDEPMSGLRPIYGRRWPALARAEWLPGIGDGALANVGSGCTGAGSAAISLGTSGAVRTCYPAKRGRAPRGLWEYRLDEKYVVVGGAVTNGGNAIEWATRVFGGGVPSPACDHGLTILPLLSGERTPWWDDRATAAIAGLRQGTRASEIAGALVEAVALRLAAAGRTLLETRPGIKRLVASGGALAKQPVLAQVIADAIGRPVALASDREASTRGAAIVALARIGALRSIEVAAPANRTYRPRKAMRDRYQSVLARQDRLYAVLRDASL